MHTDRKNPALYSSQRSADKITDSGEAIADVVIIIPIRNDGTNEKINTNVVIICNYVQRFKADLISVRCVNLRGKPKSDSRGKQVLNKLML